MLLNQLTIEVIFNLMMKMVRRFALNACVVMKIMVKELHVQNVEKNFCVNVKHYTKINNWIIKMRTNQKAIDLDDYLDDNLADRTRDKFMALPDFYKSTDGKERYTNIEDAVDGIKQEDWITIARYLRDEQYGMAGSMLADCLKEICESQAEEELEDEFESGNPQSDAMADRMDNFYQRRCDAQLDD